MSEPEVKLRNISCHGYVFDDFTLDLDRGCLWRAGEEIKLRHKSFEALKYLVEHHGRLVSKAEMIQALWPDVFVTDDSLVQCLIDVRRALGDDEQRYIKTILRRGYLFDAQVSESSQSNSDELGISDTAQSEATNSATEGREKDEEKVQPKNIGRNGSVVDATGSIWSRWRSHSAILPAALLAVLLLTGLISTLVWRSSRRQPA